MNWEELKNKNQNTIQYMICRQLEKSKEELDNEVIEKRINEIFYETETLWNNIIKQYFSKYKIKYLMIAESPPWTSPIDIYGNKKNINYF